MAPGCRTERSQFPVSATGATTLVLLSAPAEEQTPCARAWASRGFASSNSGEAPACLSTHLTVQTKTQGKDVRNSKKSTGFEKSKILLPRRTCNELQEVNTKVLNAWDTSPALCHPSTLCHHPCPAQWPRVTREVLPHLPLSHGHRCGVLCSQGWIKPAPFIFIFPAFILAPDITHRQCWSCPMVLTATL